MKATTFEFGPFVLDPARLELRRRGVRVRLPVSRLRLLALFLSRPGELITREEIAACLWKDSQSVDVISGINTAVNQLRVCLGDDSAAPRYIETIIGAGYRFIAEVTEVAPDPSVPRREISGAVKQDSSINPLPGATTAPFPGALTSGPDPAATMVLNPGAQSIALPRRVALHPWRFAAFAVVCLIIVMGFVLHFGFLGHASPPQVRTASLELSRLTITGDILAGDISPDGKYVAYVRVSSGQQSIWLKQLATGTTVPLTYIGSDVCAGVDFSPDGNYLYFARQKPLLSAGELYRISTLGGEPVRVLTGISGEPVISPDGRKVAFVRSTLMSHGMDSIVIADVDGANARVLISYPAPGIRFNRLTWTADGQNLAYPLQSKLVLLPVNGGPARTLPDGGWSAIDGVWGLPPGGDLLVVGERDDPTYAQIYVVPISGGPLRPVTHDFSDYIAVRATADGKALLAVQRVLSNSLQSLISGTESEPLLLSVDSLTRGGEQGLAVTKSDEIVYTSYSDRGITLNLIDDAGNSHPIRDNENFGDLTVAPRGDVIVATRWLTTARANLYLIDKGTGRETRLTDGKQDYSPSFTPDGEWIVYASIQDARPVLMKVSVHGGTPASLTDYNRRLPGNLTRRPLDRVHLRA